MCPRASRNTSTGSATEPARTAPSRLFCDTSFFYACLDPADANHDAARALAEDAAGTRAALWTTWDIISETVTLLRYRGSFRAALAFLDEVKPQLHVVRYGDRVRDEAELVLRRYGQDHRLSLCDSISLVVVTTLLDRMPCLAFDEDSRGLGLPVMG